jgi:hypothetical protein
MPLAHRIDHRLRLVLAWASGTLTDEEVFAYQKEVWSRPDVAGYDELVDMTAGQRVVPVSLLWTHGREPAEAVATRLQEALGVSRE